MSMNTGYPPIRKDQMVSDEDVKTFQTKIKMDQQKKATEEQKSNLRLYFGPDDYAMFPVRNIVIEFANGKVINAREKYALNGFKMVKIFYKCGDDCLHIVGYGSPDSDGQMFIRMQNIVTIGIDQKVKEGCIIEN